MRFGLDSNSAPARTGKDSEGAITAELTDTVAMKVLIPSALRSYTEASQAEASGATVAAVLADLERRYTGIRFRMIDEQDRIRPHIRIFVNGTQVHDLAHALRASDEVVIVQALSGG